MKDLYSRLQHLSNNVMNTPLPMFGGMLLGLLLAISGILDWEDSLPDSAVASVNGQLLHKKDLNAHKQGLEQISKFENKTESEAQILERMIEEELLVQRALEIGLIASNNSLRGNLTRAMIDVLIAEEKAKPISQKDLLSYFNKYPNRFRKTDRVQAQIMLIQSTDKDEVEAISDSVKKALRAGSSFASLVHQYGELNQPILPNTLLPVSKIKDYLGSTIAEVLTTIPKGSVSDAIESDQRFYLLYVTNTTKGPIPQFDSVKEQVMFQYERARSDIALREYLKWLKARADIQITRSRED